MAREYKKWTEEELKDLLQLVAEHPNNFREAFRIHAANNNRNVTSVELKFQRYRNTSEAKTCMITISKRNKIPNRKNIYPGTGGTASKVKVSIWKKVLNILGL